MMELSNKNADALHWIENALFCVTLEDSASGADPNAWHRAIYIGRRGGNVWWDKSLNIIVESNGRIGVNGEHSPCDAFACTMVFEYALRTPIQNDEKYAPTSVVKEPHEIEFIVDQHLIECMQNAQHRIDQVIDDSDSTLFYFTHYGTDFIKSVKLHPDAYVQMAIQLAYYRIHGTFTATYETAGTRKYLYGRTECTRTLSTASKEFVLGMQADAPANVKYELLVKAVDVHVKYARMASEGFGVDRHFLGMQAFLRPGESHPMLQDKWFMESKTWHLSTSSLGAAAANYLMGVSFGAATHDGYGMNYHMNSTTIRLGVESKRSCTSTSSAAFTQAFVDALQDMQRVCQHSSKL
jgi:carnitine O-acetyltransferase